MTSSISDLMAEKLNLEAEVGDLRQAIEDSSDIGQQTRLGHALQSRLARIDQIEREAAAAARRPA